MISPGSTYAATYVSFNNPGSTAISTSLTASAQGLASSTQVTIEPYPLSFSLSLSNPQLKKGQNAVITATVMLNGMGLGGATVKFSSINCAITPSQTVTSQAGVAQRNLKLMQSWLCSHNRNYIKPCNRNASSGIGTAAAIHNDKRSNLQYRSHRLCRQSLPSRMC